MISRTVILRGLAALAASALLAYTFISCADSPVQTPPSSAEIPFDDSFYSQVSLGERGGAMGATDPSWSADGETIAFSLFGSVWTMPASGGEARQITAKPGYDAGTAWSPDGRFVAFVRGKQPSTGAPIATEGQLTVVDPRSGKEQTLAADRKFLGVPTWTRDSRTLIANQTGPQGTALYQVPLDGSSPQQLTSPWASRAPTALQRSKGWYVYWSPAAVDLDSSSIVFGDDRDGTPQLWRMPLLHEGLIIASKLTHFPEPSQADIQDLTWEPGGSVVFSNNLHGERTTYDLWRWDGGAQTKVTQLTNTLNDEFSPRSSPDGKKILFVSNYLGTLDLFETTPEVAPARHVKIERLNFQKPAATLRVQLRDETGKTVGSRISVRGSDGKYYTPPGALYRYHNGMGDGAGFFHASGDFELAVPSGEVQIAAYHGLEHEPVQRRLKLEPGRESSLEVRFERFANWQGNGWWSGEDHIHANYAGPYYLRPEDAMAMVKAENFNVANMMVANTWSRREIDREFFAGKPNELSTDDHILYWNEEYRNGAVYGHMAILNLLQLTDPIYASFPGTAHPYDYPSNTMVATQVREGGALVAYVHPTVGSVRDPFELPVGAKELPVTAALGQVDVVDIYPWGPVAREIWYRLLNCGFRIAPGAGTDTFSNWRHLNLVPGVTRAYVEAEGPLSYESWIRGLRQGKSFVTNGPLLLMEVNGVRPGGTLTSASGQSIEAVVTVRVESRLALGKVELIQNGEVVGEQDAKGARQFNAEFRRTIGESGWLAARVSGSSDSAALLYPAEAHTAPVYAEVGGQAMRPRSADAALFVDWIDRLWDLVQLRNNFENEQQKQQVRALVMKAREFYERNSALSGNP